MKIHKRINYLVLLIIIIAGLSNAQQIKIKVFGYQGKSYISSVTGEKTTVIDSMNSDSIGNFIYKISNKKLDEGLYRFSFDKNKFLDFIFDGKDVSIVTTVNDVADSLQVIKSESNKLFYSFLRLNKAYKTKTGLLQFVLARYPKDDDYYKTTQNKYVTLQQEYLRFVDTTSQINPDSFVARYIKSSELPVVDYNLPPEKQLSYLKKHALDKVDFNDGELTFSDLFTNKTIEYLTYYRNPQLPKELLEKEFTKAIDTLLNKAKVNIRVYKQIVEYLIDGFRKFGFENDVEYVVKNYVVKDDICLNKKTEISIRNMIDQMKFLHKGVVVPNIIMKDAAGNEVDLAKIKADKILILFYASWCPHCQKLIPKLVEFINEHRSDNLKVLAVSLDNNRSDWLNFIKNNKMNFANVHSNQGWDCKAAKKYFIYATPTMFLLNKKREILGKPSTVEGLKKLM